MSMIAGLSAMELGRLRMSVGYGTHKKGRPLSPIEVGLILRSARDAGFSLRDCATAVNLKGTGHIGRFLRVLNLPHDLQHLVDWGTGKDFIGFSAAVELERLPDANAQRAVARSILSDGLNSKEVRQVGQLRMRSGRTIDACIKEILGMRPMVERRYVFIGSVVDQNVLSALTKISQGKRNSILESGIQLLGLRGATGRLGKRFFTLVGDERFNASMKKIGKERIEARLRTEISEKVENGQDRG